MYIAKRFQASSPESKANGQLMLPYYDVLRGTPLAPLISRYGLDQLEPHAYYPQQWACDMQKAMLDHLGLFSGELTLLGFKSVESIGFPDHVRTIGEAMQALQQIYQRIHRNIPPEEGWTFRQDSEDQMRIGFNAPYEPFAAYGYINGIAQRFSPSGRTFTVQMDESGAITTYLVRFS